MNLLAAKTRVAPIKQVSLSRLELSATALLSTLMESILQAFNHLEVEPWAYTGESQEELLEESLKKNQKEFTEGSLKEVLECNC